MNPLEQKLVENQDKDKKSAFNEDADTPSYGEKGTYTRCIDRVEYICSIEVWFSEVPIIDGFFLTRILINITF